MTTTEEISLHAKRTFPHEDGFLRVKVSAYRLGNNAHPHFSVTGETKYAAGCIHEECQKAWPVIKPLIALHLSNADNGEPMYALENGWYWMAGALGGSGEKYHGGSGNSGKSEDECLRVFANYVRITIEKARHLRFKLKTMPMNRKLEFAQWLEEQKPRWQRECNEGINLLKELATQNTQPKEGANLMGV